MVGIAERRVHALEQRREPCLALVERTLAQILAVELQQVEQVVADVPAAVAQRVLQRAEIGVAFGVSHRDLAVEQRAVARQFRQRRDQ
jgi:hypothetical protein